MLFTSIHQGAASLSFLQLARQAVRHVVVPGSVVVDATMGNGHDTLFLAECVGETGQVYGFDLQSEALLATRKRLDQHGLLGRAQLFAQGHEEAPRLVPTGTQLHAVMFNLGFLPGSDKGCITRTYSTLEACKGLAARMAPGAVMTVHCYTGHAGGLEEAHAVRGWAMELPRKDWWVQALEDVNKEKNRESLFLIWRQHDVHNTAEPHA